MSHRVPPEISVQRKDIVEVRVRGCGKRVENRILLEKCWDQEEGV